jgi:hypothetical protein
MGARRSYPARVIGIGALTRPLFSAALRAVGAGSLSVEPRVALVTGLPAHDPGPLSASERRSGSVPGSHGQGF